MAYQEERAGSNLTYMQQVAQVVGAVMEGYTLTQAQIASSVRASNQIIAAGVALGEIEDPNIREIYRDFADVALSGAECAAMEAQRDAALLERDAAEQGLSESLSHFKQYVGGLLLGRTLSVRIRDEFRSFQSPGENGLQMPSEVTGRFAGYEPMSATLWVMADDRYPIRLYIPDLNVPNKIRHAAIITAIDFPD